MTDRNLPALLGVLFGTTALGSSAMAVVAPEIASDFDLDTSGIAAVFVSFGIAFAATTAVYGRIGDLHGQRRPLIAGIVIMSAGAFLSAAAPELITLLAGRVLQGAGAGAIPALVPGVLSARIDEDEQSAALGIVAALAGVFSAVGPLLGGLASAAVSWRFALALPALSLVLVPAVAAAAPDGSDATDRLDTTGAGLVAAAATGLVLVLQAPGLGPLVGAVGAIVLVGAAVPLRRHLQRVPEGFAPRTIINNPAFWLNAVVGATLAGVYLSLLLSVPVRLAETQSWTAIRIGLALVPAAAAGPIASAIGKRLTSRIRSALLAGIGVAGAGGGAITAAAVDHPIAQVVGLGSALFGFGLAQPALIDRIARATAPDVRGIAIGLFNLVFFLGGAAGSAVVGSFGVDAGSVVVAGAALAAGVLLARRHDTPYERCVRSTGTVAGALHCLGSQSSPDTADQRSP